MADDLNRIQGILGSHRKQLLKRAHVVATGIGYKQTGGTKTDMLCIVCSVIKKVPATQLSGQDLVPAAVDGTPTDVVQTGVIRALQAPTDRFRPAPGGVSVGHVAITAGTLGCWVTKNGQKVILSNNHVLANSNDAEIGDAILQPGPFDSGSFPQDHIANLTQFVPISFQGEPSECQFANAVISVFNLGCRMIDSNTRYKVTKIQAEDNRVDAAIATPLNAADVKDEIINIGPIQGTVQGELGMAVKKSGRTTGFTTGEIQQVDVTANVQYGAGQTAVFTDQLLAGAMSQGGDSGSAVLDDNNRLTGLLFAGSDTTTIINRIENVFSALGVSL
jgi:V8-like Glu-specific endopeptidase